MALLRPKTPPATVIAGIAAGLGAALRWKLLLWQELLGSPWDELELVIPALSANVIAMIATSFWVRSQDTADVASRRQPCHPPKASLSLQVRSDCARVARLSEARPWCDDKLGGTADGAIATSPVVRRSNY